MNSKECHFFNMFICRKELADDYFEWIFDVLSKVKPQIDFEKYPEDQRKILGFFSERLINIYVMKNNLKVKERPILIKNRAFPLMYVIGFRFSFIFVLFKWFTKIRHMLAK